MRGMQQLGAFFIQASGAGCTAAPGLPFLIYPATSPGHPLPSVTWMAPPNSSSGQGVTWERDGRRTQSWRRHAHQTPPRTVSCDTRPAELVN